RRTRAAPTPVGFFDVCDPCARHACRAEEYGPMAKKPTEHVVVVTGDLHLDEHGAWKHRDLIGDSRYAFEQIVNYCVTEAQNPQQQVQLVLLGDIFNKPDPK